MKKTSIKTHLKPYFIYDKRVTTLNHAFASAIAPNDVYNEVKVNEAIRALNQNPDDDLYCFYCDNHAETWDHIYGLVKDTQYSGFGHVLGNLLPCCKKCNSQKGNKDWRVFLSEKIHDTSHLNKKVALLENYLRIFNPKKYILEDIKKICKKEFDEYEGIRQKITKLLSDADKIATKIREEFSKK